jgi:hypothetical protein
MGNVLRLTPTARAPDLFPFPFDWFFLVNILAGISMSNMKRPARGRIVTMARLAGQR